MTTSGTTAFNLNLNELIEEAFVDGDDTYKAWLEMGRIAKNALEQHQSENK